MKILNAAMEERRALRRTIARGRDELLRDLVADGLSVEKTNLDPQDRDQWRIIERAM